MTNSMFRRSPCVLLPLLAVLAISWRTLAADPLKDGEEASGLRRQVDGTNAFAIELYHNLSAEKGSFFLSPASIHMALSMAQVGARGESAAALAKLLHATDSKASTDFAKELLAALNQTPERGREPAYTLELANALWSAQGYPLMESFTRTLKESFSAEARELDFENSTARACDAINAWVKEKTKGRIAEIVNSAVVNKDTRLVLTNAIYFKSAWEEAFSESSTKNEPFHISSTKTVTVPLMNQQEHFLYWETPLLQGVTLPYTRGELSMVLLVPREVEGLPQVERELTSQKLQEWSKQAKTRKVQLTLPRFRTESSFSLKETLSALGCGQIFTDGADLSGMSSKEKLLISAVLHKSFIALDEKGTEAAAVTAIVARPTAAVQPEKPVVVKADRPFLYVIQHNRTGAILFLGRLVNPEKA